MTMNMNKLMENHSTVVNPSSSDNILMYVHDCVIMQIVGIGGYAQHNPSSVSLIINFFFTVTQNIHQRSILISS